MSRKSDFMVEQTVFLGGQISKKHKIFQLARMSPDYAEMYAFIQKYPDIIKKLEAGEDIEAMLDVIEIFGEMDLLRSVTEITLLSMILGDTSKSFSMKKTG